MSIYRGRKEGRRVPGTGVGQRHVLQLRGAGFGVTAVQTDSFQVRLEPRFLRVHGIICSSEYVKELRGIAGNGVQVCCCGWDGVQDISLCFHRCLLHQ